MPAPRSANWHMANRLAEGHLAEIIIDLRAQGNSHERIARQLHADYGIDTTKQTVHSWCRLLATDTTEPVAS